MVFGRMNPFSRSGGQESEAEATQPSDEAESGDIQDASASERPGIADKVRFWEEQDRINRELIPRVLKQNELLSAHVTSHEEVRLQTTSINSRIDEMAERHAKEMAELEARTAAGHEEVKLQTTSINSRVDEMAERHTREMAELEARMAAEVRSSNRFALAVSMASAGIAALAVLLVFVY